MDISKLNKKLKKVPPQLIPEIMDYIDFLINKYSIDSSSKGKFKFQWSGGLADVSKQYTSVQLQHKAVDWR